jgi:hypothetical protein
MDMNFVDPAHKTYQYSLRMAPREMKQIGVQQCEYSGTNIY